MLIRYNNVTNSTMYCKLQKPEVNYYNATILVSNNYGRSIADPDAFFVAPNDTLYNYQTYARKNFNQ